MWVANIDRKQIKRIRVEVIDGSATEDDVIIVNLWNATGRPLRDDTRLSILFYTMDVGSAPAVTEFLGVKRVERGDSAAGNITSNTELIFSPDPDTGMVVFSLFHDGGTYPFLARCGNATYAGQIYTGPRRRPGPGPGPFPPPWPRPRPPGPRPRPLPL